MRFNKISFENYRCFLNGSIDFKKNRDKNMTILIAPNGGGKTETLFAFWWALYDYDFSKLTNKEQTPYALNSGLYRKLEQSKVGASEKCSVTVEFEDDGITYQVKKWCEFRKTEKQVKVEEFREFSNYKENGELSLPQRDPASINKYLSRIIPKNILYGIIFDGERMQKLNTPDESSVNAIRAVINDITNVELLENCAENFMSIRRKLNKDLKQVEGTKGNKSLEDILNDESQKIEELDRLNVTLEENRNELEFVENELEKISNLLSKNKEVQDIENDRRTQRDLLANHEKNLDNYYKNFTDTLSDGYLFATEKILNDVEDIIKKYDVPQDLTVPAVKSIMTRSKCICGRNMDEDAIKELQKLISLLPPDNINSTLSEVIRQTRQMIKGLKENAKQTYNLIQNCEAEIKECKSTIASLSARITSIDDSGESAKEAIKLENDNTSYTFRKGVLSQQIPSDEAKIKELNSEIDKLHEQRENYAYGSSKASKINDQITYIDKCKNAVDRIKDINKETALEEININLENSYKLLSEDAERGRKIKIIQHNNDKRYQIAVYMEDEFERLINKWKQDGTYENKISMGLSETEIEENAILNCIDSNSTGQSKINTFAFVKAILDYSNSPKSEGGFEIKKDYPLLIDAPFGDISAGNLSKSSSELHNFANQVILMIDEDKYNSLKDAFEPYTANKYMFEKADGKNYSIIKEVES